jgi:hypothetical protein
MTYKRKVAPLATAVAELSGTVRDAIRIMRSDATYTRQQSAFLAHYPDRYITGLAHLLLIARTCRDEATSLAFPNALRGFVIAGRPVPTECPREMLRLENDADTDEDRAVFAYMQDPNPGTRARAIECLRRQELASRAAADALHRDAGRGRFYQ